MIDTGIVSLEITCLTEFTFTIHIFDTKLSMILNGASLALTSPQARLEMPMDWRRAKGGRLAILVSVEKSERPRVHGDVTIALCGGHAGGRNHGHVRLVLAALDSYPV